MSQFDLQTERCVHCDGHWRHYHPCPYLNCEFVHGRGYTDNDPECAKLGTNVPHPQRMCECGCPMDEDVGDCLDCGTEWQDEGRHLHFGASGMFCCSCAESRRNGNRYAY